MPIIRSVGTSLIMRQCRAGFVLRSSPKARADAEKTLDGLRRAKADSVDQRVEIEKARYEALNAQKKNMRALETLATLSEIHPQPAERDRYRARLADSVDSRFSEDELVEIARIDAETS